ncbi:MULTISPECIES: hypothetical protein [Trichocoleus]|uniref:Uncharacterized protein n=1 Tax=Trichocoleus desertorum GB2-A4 TaxID=2933944 RepID=A0ABV0JFX9_9CYAN|nr:hypothetical protein [Trichocoleus sp. FACHB-46]MBD1865040.1 hypothetical protein [Trichocoleus sp. FACHB-46]
MPPDAAKVTGYVRQVVYDRLLEFKETHKLKSISQAVTLVLENYFGISLLSPIEPVLPDRVSDLEEQMKQLSEVVTAIQVSIEKLSLELYKPTGIELELGKGLTQAELAQRFRVRESTISRNKSKLKFTDWSKRKDPEYISWAYSLQTKLFFPR